jgi:biopolymer transport protein ExbB/TolQ
MEVKMQFVLIEMDGLPYTSLGKMAIMFILVVLVVLIHHAITLQIRYRRLWRFSQLLGQPLLTQLETGKWEPAELSSWREIKDLKFMTVVEALRQELPSRGPISMTSAISQGLDLLTGPFTRMANRIHVLGWSVCLIGWLGVLSEIRPGFRALAQIKDIKFAPVAQMIGDAIPLHLYGLIVGIACVWVSSFARSGMSFIHQDLSNRILAASAKKADEAHRG